MWIAVGIYAAKAAVKIAEDLIDGGSCSLHTHIEEMRTIGQESQTMPLKCYTVYVWPNGSEK